MYRFADFRWIVKLERFSKAYTIPSAPFGVFRTSFAKHEETAFFDLLFYFCPCKLINLL